MIAKLTGLLDSVDLDSLILDVNGVGYLVSVSARTIDALPAWGQTVSLRIETHVREDAIQLFGFATAAERDWFRTLYGVQGVGPRLALAILSAFDPQTLMQSIAAGDEKMLCRASGVGRKLAARLITELKDKVAGFALPSAPRPGLARSVPAGPPSLLGDAVSALVNLGYRPAEALGAVTSASAKLGENADLSALIKGGLQELTT